MSGVAEAQAIGSTARRHAWRDAWVAKGPFVVAAAAIAWMAIGRTLAKVGHPAATLDDAYIHFQYARAIAEGHPLRYQAGEPLSTGATSLLWPALLAPFHLLGFRGEAILWPAWAMSFAALGGVAWEAKALTAPLAGRAASIGAAAMVFAFAAFAWCAASGMEVLPFAWLLARCARRASEWTERTAEGAGADRRARELVILAWGAAFMRPEGAVAAVAVAVVMAAFPAGARRRAWALAPLAAAVAPSLLLWALTGSPTSSTARVKLLVGNPYYAGKALVDAVFANVTLLARNILDGGVYSAEFLPSGGATLAIAGLFAVAVLGWRTGRVARAALVVALALGMLVPCLYLTFLWNRLRYVWPFATGWLVGLACLARLAADALGLVHARWRQATGLLCGVVVGMLASHLDWALEDVAASASGIDRQQATLGRWAKANLPPDARIGVNDTGAIAYFGDRRTFDVVGLTTPSEARYWVAGAGSRLEHYERMRLHEPWRLPTHFIVYPHWLACDAVLGAVLGEATVTDASILGGQTMRVYDADYTRLGSGEEPWTPWRGRIADAVDVADLESEAAHAYAWLGARDGEEIAELGAGPDGRTVVDGGRTQRTRERFTAHLARGAAYRGIARVEAASPVRAHVRADGRDVATIDVAPLGWTEVSFVVPADAARDATTIELLVEEGALTVFHYWFVDEGAASP